VKLEANKQMLKNRNQMKGWLSGKSAWQKYSPYFSPEIFDYLHTTHVAPLKTDISNFLTQS
jgi:hypothetical protein